MIRKLLEKIRLKDHYRPCVTDRSIYEVHLTGGFHPRIILDVGAHIGHISKNFHQTFPEANIYSFEAVKSTFDQLKKNTEKNRDAIKVFNLAMGSEVKTENIYLHGKMSESNSLSLNRNTPQIKTNSTSEKISISTLAKISKEEGFSAVDILKTDTEGYDLEVLKGAGNLLDKTQYVVAEAGLDFDKHHTNLFSLRDFLTGKGFQLVGLYDISYRSKKRPGIFKHCNALFLKMEKLNNQT